MISDEIAEFLGGPVIFSLATANTAGHPWFTRSFLVTAESAKNALHIFIPKVMSERPLADLEINNRVATGGVDFTNFKTRQFKGRMTGFRDANTAEIQQIQSAINVLAPMFGQFFGPGSDAGWRRYNVEPSVRLTIELDEIYNQTPGPGTGGRIQ